MPTAEQTNALQDDIAAGKLERAFPERDLLIFELLYGCGLRISEPGADLAAAAAGHLAFLIGFTLVGGLWGAREFTRRLRS